MNIYRAIYRAIYPTIDRLKWAGRLHFIILRTHFSHCRDRGRPDAGAFKLVAEGGSCIQCDLCSHGVPEHKQLIHIGLGIVLERLYEAKDVADIPAWRAFL